MSFWRELNRRNVFKVGAAYALIAWIIAQVVSLIEEPLNLPAWFDTTVLVLLGLGFPLALLFAWAYELTPSGLKRSDEVPVEASIAVRTGQKLNYVLLGLVLGAVAVGALWLASRDTGADWLREEALPAIEARIEAGDWEGAFAAATEAAARAPNSPALDELWPRFSWRVTIPSEPPGATVWRRPYDSSEDDWVEMGVTPLEDARIPFGLSRLRFELDGYSVLDRTIGSGSRLLTEELPAANAATTESGFVGTETFTLDTVATLPDGKVRVPAWEENIGGNNLSFSDFFLDRTEVTNAEYKTFVDAGGYQQPDYWDPIERDGDLVPWAEAMDLFRDETGRFGPVTWVAGDYPEGESDFPVYGVSWYEASAYARFMRQELPTIYHWRRAIAGSTYAWELPASNFNSDGPRPVTEGDAMSFVGAFDLAGNVREWTASASGDGRLIAGGSFNDPPYAALPMNTGPVSPLDRTPANGFRLAITRDAATVAERSRAPVPRVFETPEPEPVSDEVYAALSRAYAYEPSPLNATVEGREETRLWTRERITLDSAYDESRVTLYLYLPQNMQRPYQTVVYWPGGDALSLRSFDDSSFQLDFVVKSGRAVAFPVYLATFERGPVAIAGAQEMLQTLIKTVKDFRRSIDYLETRPDIDPDRFGFFGHSWGAAMSAPALAQEPRIRAAIAYVGYVPPPSLVPWGEPEIDTVNSLPRVEIPMLMLNGEFDTAIPPGSDELFYQLLGTAAEHKRHRVAPSGHFVPQDILIQETLDWLDTYLGDPRDGISGLAP